MTQREVHLSSERYPEEFKIESVNRIGWAMSFSPDSKLLTIKALEMAWETRGQSAGVIFHSNQGATKQAGISGISEWSRISGQSHWKKQIRTSDLISRAQGGCQRRRTMLSANRF